jgi:hypothetical protein
LVTKALEIKLIPSWVSRKIIPIISRNKDRMTAAIVLSSSFMEKKLAAVLAMDTDMTAI